MKTGEHKFEIVLGLTPQIDKRLELIIFVVGNGGQEAVRLVNQQKESGNVASVLDGNLDNFISAYLKYIQLGNNQSK